MTYQGTVKNGVVVFQSAVPPEGTQVRVELIEQPAAGESTRRIWDKMNELAGRADTLPPDAARNHDHYLYGKPGR
jgi:hypothetical protein